MTKDKTENIYWKMAPEELEALDKTGIETVKVLELNDDGDQLMEATSYAGDTLRGKWIAGEAAADIRWQWENVDGWPQSVQL